MCSYTLVGPPFSHAFPLSSVPPSPTTVVREMRPYLWGPLLILLLISYVMPAIHACPHGCGMEFKRVSQALHHKSDCQAGRQTTAELASSRGDRLQNLLPVRSRNAWLANMVPESAQSKRRIRAMLEDETSKEVLRSSSNAVAGGSNSTTGSQPTRPPSQDDMPYDMPFNDENVPTPMPELPMEDITPAPPQLTKTGRPRRAYRLPKRFVQVIPEPTPPLPAPQEPVATLPRVRLIVRDRVQTAPNIFGVRRDYPRRPTYDPDSTLTLEDLATTSATGTCIPDTALASQEARPAYWPFANATIKGIMSWLNNGVVHKSEAETTKLISTVFQAETFEQAHLQGFDAHRENIRLDKALKESATAGFKECSVSIEVPSGDNQKPASIFSVPGLLYRSLTSVIKEAFTGQLAHHHHFSPFKHIHVSPVTQQETRIYDEVYTSDAFLEANEEIQVWGELPPDDLECRREKVVAAMMFLSDATHLTNFGNAKAWPIYLMMGNLSKYIRSQPGSGVMHHVAYIPSLPDSFQDFAAEFNVKWRSQKDKILTHCRRDLMHAVWEILLDEDFLRAYQYGIVVMCSDGIERRIYPRIFTYSADYPEKVLLATVRDKGSFPCVRCMVPKSSLDRLATRKDMKYREKHREFQEERVKLARILINDRGKGVGSAAVETLLKEFSAVPTMNAFVKKLNGLVNPSTMLVVDLLHEFELGVWKAVFVHLVRILYAAGRGSDELVVEFDRRFREISTFGISTIRTFSNNTSEMKRLAARDYEDILQCAIPAFEGLLDDKPNREVMKLLYRMAEWHGLAKLRMHTETSLTLFEGVTKELGDLLRKFRDFSDENFKTYELPREMESRVRRENTKVIQVESQQAGEAAPPPTGGDCGSVSLDGSAKPATTPVVNVERDNRPAPTSGRKTRKLNLSTVKLHFLGDYVQHIRRFGTTDSYSTQLGELAHRLLKSFYALTNKRDAGKQMAKKYERMENLRSRPATPTPGERVEVAEGENARLDCPYFISHSRLNPLNIMQFVQTKPMDPTKRLFIPTLKNHILGRLLNRQFDGDDMDDFTEKERSSIRFMGDRMYRHATFRINYTTYDMRRAYDTVNPRTRPFIMLASPEKEAGAHPFWYASVMGIFHATVQRLQADGTQSAPQEMEFLWVRWLGVEPGYKFGRKAARLPKIGFVKESDDYAFGFVDPALVLCGCHLIPAFADGKTEALLSTKEATEARKGGTKDDWTNYYVGIFVDRDMLMRHLGIGIGHQGQTNRDEAAAQAELENEEEGAEEEGENDVLMRLAQELEHDKDDEAEGGADGDEDESDSEEEEPEFDDGDLGYDDL